ncbi:MAG: hypothetical protein ACLFUB_13780 [Cyclobacteriaceae bacterium]
MYTRQDFEQLLLVIQDLKNLKSLAQLTTEEFLSSEAGINSSFFIQLGLTDALIVALGKNCDLLITADSALSDIALANGIKVYDLVQIRNKDFRDE